MAAQFDPYYQWLGIPPEEQPAHFYQLLGIKTFEDNLDVIEASADRQMGHLRNYQTGKHSALSQELLNEVSAARVCLLNPAKKAAYDQKLRQELEPKPATEAPVVPIHVDTSPRVPHHKKPAWPIPVGLGAAVVVVLLALVLWPSPETAPSDGARKKKGDVPARVAAKPGVEADGRAVASASSPTPKTREEGTRTPEDANPARPDLGPMPELDMTGAAPQGDPPAADLPDSVPTHADVATGAEPDQSEAPVRLPIPSQARQEEIGRDMEEAYELSQAKSPDDQLQLAGELLELGVKSDDADERFTVLRKAMGLASAGGDAALMLRAADATATEFDVDGLAVKAKIMGSFSHGARTESRTKSFIESVEPVIDEALAADRCDIALELVSTAYKLCQGSTDREHRKVMYDRRKEIQEFHKRWQIVERARAELETDANNADAHLIVGRHLCFTIGDWQRGLPHLAQSADEPLKALAQRDLQLPEKAEDQLALADAWWDLDTGKDDTASAACRARAAGWYGEALPRLAGISKLKAEQRVEELAAAEGHEGISSPTMAVRPRLSPEEQLRLFTEALRNAKPVNLGPEINSEKNDRGPALSADGCTLVFQSDRPGGLGGLDLWMGVRTSPAEPFGPPVNLGSNVNSNGWDYTPVLSLDGRQLLFTSTRPGGLGDSDLWMCSRASSNKPFGQPVNLGPVVNSPERECGLAVSNDGLSLLFASARPGGLGSVDLWECTRRSLKKPFGPPHNLGPTVNSEAVDAYPALSADGRILLFHSDRPGGLGSSDLWMCTRTTADQPFGPPVNLGPGVNSNTGDSTPMLSADGRLLLFGSRRPGGRGDYDLWMVELDLPANFSLAPTTRQRTASKAPARSTPARSPSRSKRPSAALSPEQWIEALRNAKPVNLGPEINSDKNDSGPALSADGCTLLFQSDRPGGLGGFDLWMSVRASRNEPFSEPVNLGANVNSTNRDYAPAPSPDGLLLLFASDRGGRLDHDLWMCGRQSLNNSFSAAENLGSVVNSQQRDCTPALSNDGLSLLFSSMRPGGLGELDLWMCEKKSLKAPFGPPRNLGAPINGTTNDAYPALSADGRILLFNSRRTGGHDLWMCTRVATNQPFGPPVHLGPSINSSADDSTPMLSADGRLLLFSSRRPGGRGDSDLWMVELDLPTD